IDSVIPKVRHDRTDAERLEKVIRYIIDHFKDEPDSKEAASIACMNEAAFCRYFKRRTEKTFSQFVNYVRVTHATNLLSQENWSIASICYECGYKNISYFNRQFKSIIGHTPIEYRSNHLGAAETLLEETTYSSYQNIIYKATSIPQTNSAPAAKPRSTPNIRRSTSNPLACIPRCRSHWLMPHIPITHNTKTMLIRSRKGISNCPEALSFANPMGSRNDQFTQYGENLSHTDKINPPIVANNAALDVVPFQKNPRMNMAKIPGETKPVYSWMYWKPPFLSIPRKGAITTATNIETTTVHFPTCTIFRSETGSPESLL